MKFKLFVAAAMVLAASACDTNVLMAEREETVSRTGVVREVDPTARRFVVSSEGQRITMRANEQLVNFDQLEVGDRVRVEFRESVAVSMAAPDDTGEPSGASVQVQAPEGAKPGFGEAGIDSFVVDFISYDKKSKKATVKLPGGEVGVFEVAREMRKFAASRAPGDRILVIVEHALAIGVEEVDT